MKTERQRIVDALNFSLQHDPVAIQSLFSTRVPYHAPDGDENLVLHQDKEGNISLSVLGVINGLLEDSQKIVMVSEDNNKIVRFQ